LANYFPKERKKMTALGTLHWVLAYAGALIYVLLKVQELSVDRKYKFSNYLKAHWPSTLASAIMIPVLLLILSENLTDLLPINNLTAVLVGYQTNQIFRSLISMGKKKYNVDEDNAS